MSAIDTDKDGNVNVKGQYKKNGSEGAIIAPRRRNFPGRWHGRNGRRI